MMSGFIREKEKTQRERPWTETEALHPQANDCQQPPEARREACNGFSLELLEGTNSADTLILDFWPSELEE